jgi:hypothetical protein
MVHRTISQILLKHSLKPPAAKGAKPYQKRPIKYLSVINLT